MGIAVLILGVLSMCAPMLSGIAVGTIVVDETQVSRTIETGVVLEGHHRGQLLAGCGGGQDRLGSQPRVPPDPLPLPGIEAARRLVALFTGRAGRREVGRRVSRLGKLKEVERRARSVRRPWSAPGPRD